MKLAPLLTSIILLLAAPLCADSNLRISDVGLHGYLGSPSAVRLIVRNPSSQIQLIRLQVTASDSMGTANRVTSDVSLRGDEKRQLELPLQIADEANKVTAEAVTAGSVFGRDTVSKGLRRHNLVALMCDKEKGDLCKTIQSQIQFGGTIEQRADKNRQLVFEIIDNPREDWWAYSAASTVVLAIPVSTLEITQQRALEDYLRLGGRLVLIEEQLADPGFLAAYRAGPAPPTGQRVGKGILFRVSNVDGLGNVFAGQNLAGVIDSAANPWPYRWGQISWLRRRFATTFNFPRLGWMLLWLAAYIIVIGLVNFVVLRRLRLIEYGWISTCLLALIFAAGFYYSGARRHPKEFRLDNLATYYLDSHSGLAAADYNLRVSAPQRWDIVASIADPAVFVDSNVGNGEEANSQIWAAMNREAARIAPEFDVRLGPPREVELAMLKWSFRDLDLKGMYQFPGTIHFVSANRLRNDTGQRLVESIYRDYEANALYALPAMAPGEEFQLDTIAPKAIRMPSDQQILIPVVDLRKATLKQLTLSGELSLEMGKRLFAGFSDGPSLPVDLNVHYQRNIHSLIVVSLEQP